LKDQHTQIQIRSEASNSLLIHTRSGTYGGKA